MLKKKLLLKVCFWGSFFLLNPLEGNAQARVLVSGRNVDVHAMKGFVANSAMTMPEFKALVNARGEVVLSNLMTTLDWSMVEVQRAGEDKQFAAIGILDDGLQQNTLFSDKHPLSGVSSYRLKMISKNGEVSYSTTIQVEIKEQASLTLFPNPASSKMTVAVDGGKDEGFLKIYTLTGNELYSLHLYSSKIETDLDISYLDPGTYLMVYVDGSSRVVKQFSKN